MDQIREKLDRYGQSHVLQWWGELSPDEQDQLQEDLADIEVEEMVAAWERTCGGEAGSRDLTGMQPVEAAVCEGVSSCSPAQLAEYRHRGLQEAAAGRVGVLLLAGGQGTRLGVNHPKGMFDIGLPSGSSLYQVQAERVLRLEQLAGDITGNKDWRGRIPLYMMTSEHTKLPTQQFFKENNYFGLQEDQLVIFEQRTIPSFDSKGRFIMASKSKLARSPDGNGGLYCALAKQGVLADLARRGVDFLHVYCVDNVLVRVADPVFMGYCITRGAESANKVVEKAWPGEAVGVVCRVQGKIQVVEYSEISKETAELRSSEDGRLLYKAGNICNHFFSREFLERVCSEHEAELPHHVARKKIPFTDLQTGQACSPDKPNGVKLEKFVFDVFQFSRSFLVWECKREDEFSPLKNAEGAAQDTPTTSRESLFAQHRRYLAAAGAGVAGEGAVEISPLLSYSGEGLESYSDQTLSAPVWLRPTSPP